MELTSHACTVGDLNAEEGAPPLQCQDIPVALYSWPWGESGACCQRHQFILGQRSQALGQAVTISPLNVPAAPMTRDERTQMHAQILTLTDEVGELKNRAAELYNDNVKLQQEGRRLLARSNELDDQLRAANVRYGELQDAHDDMTAERDDLRAELERTKLLVQPLRSAITSPATDTNQPPPGTLPPGHLAGSGG